MGLSSAVTPALVQERKEQLKNKPSNKSTIAHVGLLFERGCGVLFCAPSLAESAGTLDFLFLD